MINSDRFNDIFLHSNCESYGGLSSSSSSSGSLLEMLKRQLISSTKPSKFTYQFNNIVGRIGSDTFGGDDARFYYASDVNISQHFKIILVSDCGNKRIQIFDLYSKEYLQTLKSFEGGPVRLCTDCDDLYVTSRSNCVYKYDLKKQLTHADHRYVWRSETLRTTTFEFLNGIAICNNENVKKLFYDNADDDCKLLFVCDTNHNRVVVMNSNNGRIITSFSSIFTDFTMNNTFNLIQPKAVAFNGIGDLFISSGNSVLCVRNQIQINSFLIDLNESIDGITIDEDLVIITNGRQIVVKNRWNNSFSIVHNWEPKSRTSNYCTCCLGIDGELLVLDYFGVTIFK